MTKQVNPTRDSWNDEAFQRRLQKVKEAREAKERLRSTDITQSRVGSILNLSLETTELTPIVSDGHHSNRRDYIYAHRENKGGTKKDEDGKVVRRSEESFLKEMSQPKYIKMRNSPTKNSRTYKPGYIPKSCRVESELDHVTSDPREDVDASIERTLNQTSIAESAEDRRHMSIHESLTRPLEHYFAQTRGRGRRRNDNSMSGLGHFASATKSSAYRYAQTSNHSVMHSSGAEWWDVHDSEVSNLREEGDKRVRRRKSAAVVQKERDARRHGHKHDERIAMLVTDYILKPFSGEFVDRYGHHKIPSSHSSRRRSLSLERGVVVDDYGTNVVADLANLGAIAKLDLPNEMGRGSVGRRSSSVGAQPRVRGGDDTGSVGWADLSHANMRPQSSDQSTPVSTLSKRYSRMLVNGSADASLSLQSGAVASYGTGSRTDPLRSGKHMSGKWYSKDSRAKGRMTMVEETVPGIYRPATASAASRGDTEDVLSAVPSSVGTHHGMSSNPSSPVTDQIVRESLDPKLRHHARKATRSWGPWVPVGSGGTKAWQAAHKSMHISVHQAGQERHDRMKYWVSVKDMHKRLRDALDTRDFNEEEGATDEISLALERTSNVLNVFNTEGHEISSESPTAENKWDERHRHAILDKRGSDGGVYFHDGVPVPVQVISSTAIAPDGHLAPPPSARKPQSAWMREARLKLKLGVEKANENASSRGRVRGGRVLASAGRGSGKHFRIRRGPGSSSSSGSGSRSGCVGGDYCPPPPLPVEGNLTLNSFDTAPNVAMPPVPPEAETESEEKLNKDLELDGDEKEEEEEEEGKEKEKEEEEEDEKEEEEEDEKEEEEALVASVQSSPSEAGVADSSSSVDTPPAEHSQDYDSADEHSDDSGEVDHTYYTTIPDE